VIATKNAMSMFMTMARGLTRLAEEELKICVQIRRLNSKKWDRNRNWRCHNV